MNKVQTRHAKPFIPQIPTTAVVRACSPKWAALPQPIHRVCFPQDFPQRVSISQSMSVLTPLFLLQLSRSGKEAWLEQGCKLASLNAAFASTDNFSVPPLSLLQLACFDVWIFSSKVTFTMKKNVVGNYIHKLFPYHKL